MRKIFEGRFAGKANAGLRAKIRARVAAFDAGYNYVDEAILGLPRMVGFDAYARAMLADVAEDYRSRPAAAGTVFVSGESESEPW